MRVISRVLTGAAFIFTGAGSLIAEAPHYSLTDLGTLGGDTSIGFAINSSGQVVGTSSTQSLAPVSLFIYANGGMQAITPQNSYVISNIDMNNSAFIVDGNDPAFTYSNGVMTPLSLPFTTQVFRVNNLGQMVFTTNALVAYSYDGTSYSPIGSLGGNQNSANDISDSGVIVGGSKNALGQYHAYKYDNGNYSDLGTFGGSYSEAYGLNNIGQVVGEASDSNGDSHAFLYSGGTLLNIQTIPADYSVASAINDSGTVVGSYGFYEGAPDRAGFVYMNGTMFNLNDVVDLPAGWTISEAVGINDSGQILATANFGVVDSRAIILNPVAVPEPDTVALALVGSLVVFLMRRRGFQ